MCSIMARVPVPRSPIDTELFANTFRLTSLKMYKFTRCRKCLPNLSAFTGGSHFDAISSMSISLSPMISQTLRRLTKSSELMLCSYDSLERSRFEKEGRSESTYKLVKQANFSF